MKRYPLTGQALVMGIVWLVIAAYVRPAPLEIGWVKAVLLLGAAVVVPLGLEQAIRSSEGGLAGRLLESAARVHLLAVVFLAVSVRWPPGLMTALNAVLWLGFTGVVALAGLIRLWKRRFLPLEELCFDAGLVYLAVGGGWTVLAWGGLRPLGFAAPIVLLTAVHFHYAGFALPLLTGLVGRSLPRGFWTQAAALGVIAGVPLVAVGITGSQLGAGPVIEGVAAVITALAGLLTAGLYVRLLLQEGRSAAVRILWSLSALSLAAGMILAALYGLRTWISISWLDLPWMWALHGTANSLGFAVPGLAAWALLHATTPVAETRL